MSSNAYYAQYAGPDGNLVDFAGYRASLLNRADYIGYEHIVDELEWKKDPNASHANRVFYKNETDAILLRTGAILTIVGTIEHDRPWLLTHGNFNPEWPRPGLADAKLQFTLGLPTGTTDEVVADYRSSMRSLKKLQQHIAKTGEHMWMVVDFNEEDCLRTSMPIFQKRTTTFDPWKAHEDPTMCYAISPDYQDKLRSVAWHHELTPKAIFDIDGSLIPPTVLHSRLVGALVEVSFTVQHFVNYVDKRKRQGPASSDTFTARFVTVRVLRRPNVTAESPLGTASGTNGSYVPRPSPPNRMRREQALHEGGAQVGRQLFGNTMGSHAPNAGQQTQPATGNPVGMTVVATPCADKRFSNAAAVAPPLTPNFAGTLAPPAPITVSGNVAHGGVAPANVNNSTAMEPTLAVVPQRSLCSVGDPAVTQDASVTSVASTVAHHAGQSPAPTQMVITAATVGVPLSSPALPAPTEAAVASPASEVQGHAVPSSASIPVPSQGNAVSVLTSTNPASSPALGENVVTNAVECHSIVANGSATCALQASIPSSQVPLSDSYMTPTPRPAVQSSAPGAVPAALTQESVTLTPVMPDAVHEGMVASGSGVTAQSGLGLNVGADYAGGVGSSSVVAPGTIRIPGGANKGKKREREGDEVGMGRNTRNKGKSKLVLDVNVV